MLVQGTDQENEKMKTIGFGGTMVIHHDDALIPACSRGPYIDQFEWAEDESK